jgi:hypothetical protein
MTASCAVQAGHVTASAGVQSVASVAQITASDGVQAAQTVAS